MMPYITIVLSDAALSALKDQAAAAQRRPKEYLAWLAEQTLVPKAEQEAVEARVACLEQQVQALQGLVQQMALVLEEQQVAFGMKEPPPGLNAAEWAFLQRERACIEEHPQVKADRETYG